MIVATCPSCARAERAAAAAERRAEEERERAEREMARRCTMRCVRCRKFYDARHGYGIGLCTEACAVEFALEHGTEDLWPCAFTSKETP